MAELPAPSQTLDVRTEFGLVRAYRFDSPAPVSPEPLLLIPGRSSGSPVWAEALPGLLEFSDVYCVDLLGEPGLSRQTQPILDSADQAAWLNQVLASLPEEQFAVVGLSTGGWTAANLAAHHPKRVAKLILIEPALVFSQLPLWTIVRSISATAPWLPASWRQSFDAHTARVEGVRAAEMIEAGVSSFAMALPQPQRITARELAALDMPVLAFIAGRSAIHDSPMRAAAVAERLPNSRVEVYPAASHAINAEYPDRLVSDIREFLAAA